MQFSQILTPADHDPARTTKNETDFSEKLDFKDITFLVKVRDICKSERRILSTLVLLVLKIRKNIQHMYYKLVMKKNMWIIVEKGKIHYGLFKDFNTFMYNHTLNHGKNFFAVIVCNVSVQRKY